MTDSDRTQERNMTPSEEQATPQVEGDAPAPEDELESLRAQLATAQKERDEYLNLAQRTRADFENYQKRAQRDRQEERLYAQTPLAEDILQGLDNLERAIAAAQQAGETGPLVQGVEMVQNQMLDILKRHGVTRIEALGQPFDPNLHQAVMQQPTAEYPPNTVVQVLQQGFMIHSRVLRPAHVAVSSAIPQE